MPPSFVMPAPLRTRRGEHWLARRPVRATKQSLENELVKLTLNASGEITGIRDLTCDREMAAGPCNAFKLHKDVPSWFDAWDIDSSYKALPVTLDAKAKIEVVANGPLVATLRVTRQINESELTQEISVRAGSPRVEFRTRINWQEIHARFVWIFIK